MANVENLVSIIMPTYNHGHFISRALDSVIDQTYPFWEMIIVDNYSTDDTSKIISSYLDPRIRFLKINNKGIIGLSRNKGLEHAKGSWIAFLDSDDWWEKSKLEIAVKQIKKGATLVYHDIFLESIKTNYLQRRISKKYQVKTPVLVDLLIRENPIATSTVLVRRDVLIKVGGMSEDPTMVGAEDLNTWLKIAKMTEKFVHIPKALGGYRMHPDGISKKDMSEPMRAAMSDFRSSLSFEQQKILEARLSYIKGRYLYLQEKYLIAIPYLYGCLNFGNMYLRVKALIMLLKIRMVL